VRLVKSCFAQFGSSDLGMCKGLLSMTGIRLRCCIVMSCYFQIVKLERSSYNFQTPSDVAR
jgi:hypothetical protein